MLMLTMKRGLAEGVCLLVLLAFVSINQVMLGAPSDSEGKRLSARDYANGKKRAAAAARRVKPRLVPKLKAMGLKMGNPVFVRIFKESREVELWLEDQKSHKFVLFKSYKIAAMSGVLGPKLREGDRQAPEGFYFVKPSQMNPESRFHLAFNLGYPNAYDRAHHRTGAALMMHGNRVSIGCFAMTDYYIEEIYTLCDAALKHGQPFFRVHSFPFRMTPERMQRAANEHSQWLPFWKNLKQGYDWFETKKRPPNVKVSHGRYVFD